LETIQSGVNTLFFPGGTRSRSGELEKELKMGLLGTVIEAQRARLQQKDSKKIFVVPLIISYHFVLESKYLIEQHLRKVGQEQYLSSKDAGKSYKNILKFLWDLFAQGSEIFLTVGEPMDVVGNSVNEDGVSFDQKNRQVEIDQYFKLDGTLNKNKQREFVYTKILAEKIIESYHNDNTVLSSHVVAFTLFEMIRENHLDESIFTLVGLDAEKEIVPYNLFKKRIELTQEILIQMNEDLKINLTSIVREDADILIKTGISNMGVYHSRKPVKMNENGDIFSEDLKLLYYYRNRLDHYELEKKVKKLIMKQEKNQI